MGWTVVPVGSPTVAAVPVIQGPPGPAGPAGPQGATGAAGGKGDQGATGPAGSVLTSWRGVWSAGTAYAAGDIVRAGSSSYIATAGSTGANPAADASTNDIAQVTATDIVTFGSQDSTAMGFTVDRAMTVVAIYTAQIGGTQTAGTIGIASAVNVAGPAGRVQWIGKGTPAAGRVTLDVPVDVSPGTTYYVVALSCPGSSVGKPVGAVGTHMTPDATQMWYGNGGQIANVLAVGYVLPCILYGTVASEQVWDLMVRGM